MLRPAGIIGVVGQVMVEPGWIGMRSVGATVIVG